MSDQGLGRFKFNKFILTILIWVIIIVATSSGGSRLTNDVDSEAQFIDPNTEAGRGFEIIEDRFQQVDNIVHIVVLDMPATSSQNLNSPRWQNYSLALSTMIFLDFAAIDDDGRGYKQVFSQTLLLNQAANFNLSDPEQAVQAQLLQGFAGGLIAEDSKSAIINLITDEYDFEREQTLLEEHVLQLREIVADKESVYEFATNQLNIPLSSLPTDAEYDELAIYVTGQVASFVDLIEVSASTFENSEIIAVVLILIILAIVFRSPLGVVLPIIAMFASLFPTYMITYLLARNNVFPVSDFLPSIIAMIGIAVAVDYNLFSMIRYREEYRKRRAQLELTNNWNRLTMIETQVASSRIMNQTAGQAVMYSGLTVIIGFISFIVLDSEFTTGMAIGVSIVVVFSVLSARTLTPAILSLWGRFLDWPNFMSRANEDVERQKSDEAKENELQGPWMRWSRLVMRRPVEFLVLGLLILAPFVILSSQTNLSFDSLQNLPDGTESREGFEVIVDKFNLGQTTPYLVVFDLGETTNIFDTNFNADPIFDQIAVLGAWAIQDEVKFEGIASLSLQFISGNLITSNMSSVKLQIASNGLFTEFSKDFINYEYGNNTLVVELYANLDQGTQEAWNLAEGLRDKVDELFSQLSQINDYWVTGIAPAFKDTADAMYADVPLMILVAVVLIYLALLVLFRSLILPLKAILTIGGSILFGLGTLVFIFQKGNLNEINIAGIEVWKTDQTSGIMFFLPIFIFTTILGLGMDYSIFIITRIKEEYEKGVDISTAVGIGLGKTAGVVTSAAVIMTSTFMVFALSPLLVLKMMGLALSVGIIIDATISRIILVPAAMKLAGKWNWYLPKWLKKILPEIKMEH